MGTDKLGEGAPLIACENAMTRSHSPVTIDPPQGERKPDSVNSSSSSLNRLAMVAFLRQACRWIRRRCTRRRAAAYTQTRRRATTTAPTVGIPARSRTPRRARTWYVSAPLVMQLQISDSLGCFWQAKEFHLTDARFRVLNPKLDCSKQVSKGRSVCMGGSCGD